MTSLAHKSGGLVVKNSGLATSCSCCEVPPCLECGTCDVNTGITVDDDTDANANGYLRLGSVTDPRPYDGGPIFPIHAGPYNIVWKTGYPAALECYFWFRTENECTQQDPFTRLTIYRYWLFSCEDGELVNRTNDAVTSARRTELGADINPTNTTWGYAIEDVFGTDPGSPYCSTPVEEMEPLEPDLVC